jgi:hypothetical protein
VAGREQLVEPRQQVVPRLRATSSTASAQALGFTPPAFAITRTPRSTTAGSTLSMAPTKSRA